jgi:uncharacterized repeat protein (TIGR01451 family)
VDIRTAEADLGLAHTVPAEPIAAGVETSYTLSVSNRGPCQATGVTITSLLAESVRFVSAPDSCSESGGIITCDLGTLDVGQEETVDINIFPQQPGTVTIEALVVSNEVDPDPSDNELEFSIEVQTGPAAAPQVDRGQLAYLISLLFGVPICGSGVALVLPITVLGLTAIRFGFRRAVR